MLWAHPSPAAEVQHRAPHVPWLEDMAWSAVVAEAQKVSQPILIDFYATWCGPCKALDAMVYNEAAVITELADVVTFKVDVDKARYDRLEADFGITNLPTLVYCQSDGTPWARFTGYASADTFLSRVRQWRQALAEENSFLARLESAPEDPEVLLAAYRRRKREGHLEEAATYRQKLMGQKGDGQRHAAVKILLSIVEEERLTNADDDARELARYLETMFPTTGQGEAREVRHLDLESLGEIASLQSQLSDTLGLLETYSHMINLDRGNLNALEGFARTALAAGIRLPQATTCALRAAIRTDNRPDLVAVLAACYDRRNFHARAARWLEKALVKEPDNEEFKSALARYRGASPAWLLSSP